MLIVAFIAGLASGGGAVWLFMRERIAAQRRSQSELETTFQALSVKVLQSSTSSLIELARAQLGDREKAVEQLVSPIRESLDKVGKEVRALEQVRREDY